MSETIQCVNCKKVITNDFAFCPYCGKKIATVRPSFNNMEWLSICDEKAFETEWESISSLNADEAKAWLFHMHSPVLVYKISVIYDVHYDVNRKSRGPSCDDFNKNRIATQEELKILLSGIGQNGNTTFNLKFAFPEKKYLKKSDFSSIGTDVFFTEQECLDVIRSVCGNSFGKFEQ